MMSKVNLRIASYIIGIIIIIGIIAFIMNPNNNGKTTAQVAPGTMAIQLTDPPQVPVGTQSLVISYNDLKLHLSGNSNSSGFIDVNARGSINLLNITNTTQTIGIIKTSTSQSFDMIKFNITSAKITLNNTVYNVTVPNGALTVHFKKTLTAKNGGSGVLIQLNPTVVQIYTSNQTIFILVPSAKAIVIGNRTINKTVFHVGARVRLENHTRREFEDITPNIIITSAQLVSQANNTFVSVTVKNNANVSVKLKHLFIIGAMSANIPVMVIRSSANVRPLTAPISFNSNSIKSLSISMDDLGMNISQVAIKLGMMNKSIKIGNRSVIINKSNIGTVEKELGINGNESLRNISKKFHNSLENKSMDTILNRTEIRENQTKIRETEIREKFNRTIMEDIHNFNSSNPEVEKLIHRARDFKGRYFNMLNFIVRKNGTLFLPYVRFGSRDGMEAEVEAARGYILGAGNSITLQFNRTINLPGTYGKEIHPQETSANQVTSVHGIIGTGSIPISLIKNQTYKIRITGEDGAYATTSVIVR